MTGRKTRLPKQSSALWMISLADIMSLLLAFFVMLYAATVLLPPASDEKAQSSGETTQNQVFQSIVDTFSPRLALWTGPDQIMMATPLGQTRKGEGLHGSILSVFRADMPNYKPSDPPLTMQGTYYYEFDVAAMQDMAENGTLDKIVRLIQSAPDNWRVDMVVYAASGKTQAALRQSHHLAPLLTSAGLRAGQMSVGIMQGQVGRVGLYLVPRTSLFPQAGQ